MYWHAQPTSLTLRLYFAEDGYSNKEEYLAVIQAELLGDGIAYLHAALCQDGLNISIKQWCELVILLRNRYGIDAVHIERHNKILIIPVSRAIEHLKKEAYGSNNS